MKKNLSLRLWPILLLLLSCNEMNVHVRVADSQTGMVTETDNIRFKKAFIRMNGEVLGHTDIPLGDTFVVVNEGVEGFTIREGKISIGCELKITDTLGKEIFRAPDLFEGQNIRDPSQARMLSCTITTGEPMNWEEYYDVKVVFFDQWAPRTISNQVRIRMIDIP